MPDSFRLPRPARLSSRPNLSAPERAKIDQGFLEVAQPYVAFAKILQLFAPGAEYRREIAPSAHIDPTAKLGHDVSAYPNVYVGKSVADRRSQRFASRGVFGRSSGDR